MGVYWDDGKWEKGTRVRNRLEGWVDLRRMISKIQAIEGDAHESQEVSARRQYRREGSIGTKLYRNQQKCRGNRGNPRKGMVKLLEEEQ